MGPVCLYAAVRARTGAPPPPVVPPGPAGTLDLGRVTRPNRAPAPLPRGPLSAAAVTREPRIALCRPGSTPDPHSPWPICPSRPRTSATPARILLRSCADRLDPRIPFALADLYAPTAHQRHPRADPFSASVVAKEPEWPFADRVRPQIPCALADLSAPTAHQRHPRADPFSASVVAKEPRIALCRPARPQIPCALADLSVPTARQRHP